MDISSLQLFVFLNFCSPTAEVAFNRSIEYCSFQDLAFSSVSTLTQVGLGEQLLCERLSAETQHMFCTRR